MQRFGWRVEERESQKFPTVPSMNFPIPHTEDWSVADVAVRREQQRYDRRIKEWLNP